MITKLKGTSIEVLIGDKNPTAMIGERINPTGRKALRNSIEKGEYSFAGPDAVAQAEAGATIIDINVGAPGADEPSAIREVILEVVAAVGLPVCIDSSDPKAIEAGLAVAPGIPLVNSTTGEEKVMEAILPLVRASNAVVIALCMDDNGIPDSVDGRLGVLDKILNKATKLGIPQENILVDTLVMSVGADSIAGRLTLETTAAVREKFGLNVVVGASNVSHGLPNRGLVNAMFMAMGIFAGFTAVITDPLILQVKDAIIVADLLAGKDEWAMRYIKHHRSK